MAGADRGLTNAFQSEVRMKTQVVQQPAPPEPEPYTCPELVVYGDIRQVTQAKNCGNVNLDGVVANCSKMSQ